MKVLHVVNTAQRRGSEMFAQDLIQTLNEAGVEQRVAILVERPVDVLYEAPATFLPRSRWRLPALRIDLRTVQCLRSLISSWSPDIVQSHGGDSLKYSVFAARGSRARLVYRSIGMAPLWITHGLRRAAYDWLIHQTDHVVAVAEAVRQEVMDVFNMPADLTVMIPNAVDARRMGPSIGRQGTRRALGIPPNAQVMLSIAALTWEKDPLAHLEVTRQVSRELPDVLHLIVGDGPLRGEVESRIADLGLANCVKLLGVRRDMADILTASDVLVLASRSDGMEGMPGVLIEAGMTALPVVGYEIAGVKEVVVDGVTGLLAPSGHVHDLAGNLTLLLKEKELRRRMGEAARDRCLTLFEIGAVAGRYKALYEGLITAPERYRRGSP